MTTKQLLDLARQVLTLPTAPYHEHAVREFVEAYARGLGLLVERDRVGNVVAKWQGRGMKSKSKSKITIKSTAAPLVFVAHMDHPGFEALGGNRAEFLGGVPKELFKGGRVRFYSGLECGGSAPPFSHRKRQRADVSAHSMVRATIQHVDDRHWPKHKLVTLNLERGTANPPRPGDFGMWDVPAFRVRGDRLHAAAIDDVLGVAVVLATLSEVARRKSGAHIWGVFTRAEEVGFHGAIELARAALIPRNAFIVSMEMSRARPWAKIGHGPVVRVGDRAATFDPQGTFFLDQVGKSWQQRHPDFRHQRALMDGGACEATAFAAFGYRVGGLCLPLGNYHNTGQDGKIHAEYVSVRDLERLAQLTVAAAMQWRGFKSTGAGLRQRIDKIRREAPRKL